MGHPLSKRSFVIENNILMGQNVECDSFDRMNVGEMILNTLKSEPNYVAQIDAKTGREITFEEIKNRSVKLAMWMKTEGIYPGDLVGICTDYDDGLYVILACLYIGAVPIVRKYYQSFKYDFLVLHNFMYIDPKLLFFNKIKDDEESQYANSDKTDDSLIIPFVGTLGSSQFLYDEFGFTYNYLVNYIDKHYNQIEIDNFTCTELNIFKLQTAMIIFTRGVNSSAKAVNISHKALIAPINQEMITTLPGNVGMWVGSTISFPNLIFAIHSILDYKKTIIFEGNDMIKLWRAIEKYEVNWVRLDTNLCQAILNSKDYLMSNVSSLKRLILSGSTMEHYIHADLNTLLPKTSITSLYATTETGIIAFQRNSGKPGSTGYVGRNVHLMITDTSETPLGPNAPGKIWCKCWGMSNKYYSNKISMQVTNDKGWCDTGDIGYYDDDGDIYVINRAVDLINYKEFYFSPVIIENLIKEQPGVDEVAVVAMPSDSGDIPVAFITEKKGEKVEKQDIIDIIADKLDDFMQLRGGVILLDKMHHAIDGNIDRTYLRQKAECSKNTSTFK